MAMAPVGRRYAGDADAGLRRRRNEFLGTGTVARHEEMMARKPVSILVTSLLPLIFTMSPMMLAPAQAKDCRSRLIP